MPVTVAQIAFVIKEMDKLNKIDLVAPVKKKYVAAIKKLNEQVESLNENTTTEEEYIELKERVSGATAMVLEANDDAKKFIKLISNEIEKISDNNLHENTKKKYQNYIKKTHDLMNEFMNGDIDPSKYNDLAKSMLSVIKEIDIFNQEAKKKSGPIYKIKGNDEASDSETISFIKEYLPSSGYSCISQALNDIYGKSSHKAGGVSGVKHASSGTGQNGKSCSLFFKEGDVAEIVAIANHVEVKKGQDPQYHFFYSAISQIKANKTYELKGGSLKEVK